MGFRSSRAMPLSMALLLFSVSMGCGVRGRPQPPEKPAFIGRGAPKIVIEPDVGDKSDQTVPKQSR
jgi:hypothetical protein